MFDSKECEWSDQELFVNGVRIAKVQAVSHKKAQAKEHIHAAGNEPGGIQKGNKSYAGSITLLKGALDVMNLAAIAAGGEDILDVEYTLVIHWKAKGIRAPKTHTLLGVEFTEFDESMAQGAMSMPVTLPFLFLRKV